MGVLFGKPDGGISAALVPRNPNRLGQQLGPDTLAPMRLRRGPRLDYTPASS